MFASRLISSNISTIPLAPSRRRDRRQPRGRRTANQMARLQRATMEVLELRQLLSVVTVTDTSSSVTDPHSLPYAIANAQSNETINFDLPGTAPWVISLNAPLVISRNNVTIDGPGAGSLTIQGDGHDPVVELARMSGYTSYSFYSATISGVTITGGSNASYSGGGIVNYGVLTLNNSTVSGNSAAYGGGIYNGDILFLNGDTIADNTASADGGAIDNSGQLTVSNSYFYGNMAVNGGAIENGAFLTIDNSKFAGDMASGDGGEIYNNGMGSISNSTISGASAGGRGGGIFNYGIVSVIDSTISGNTAAESGGGIFDYGSTTLINSTLADNQSTGGVGGGVDVEAIANLTATNTTIADNSATAGGGIDVAVGGEAVINNTIVAGNTVVHTSTASDVAGSLDPSSGYNLIGTGGAGGLVNHSDGNTVNVALVNADLGPLQNNNGPTETIALGANSIAINAGSNALAYDANGDPLVTDQRGYYRVFGASVDIGAYEYNAPAGPTSLVVNSTADTVAYVAGQLTLRQAIGFADFIDGSSTITFDPSVFNGSASPIDVTNGTLTFTNPAGMITLQGPGEGDLTVSGGGNSEVFAIISGANVSMSGLTITEGSSSAGGGLSNDGTLSVSDALFASNNGSDGGAIENEGELVVASSTFTGNTAVDGAAIDNSGYLTLTDSLLSNNIASYVGGAIDNDGNLVITNSTLSQNQATSGGGIENIGTININGGIFSANSATDTGGAIDNQSILTVTGATFSGNSAAQGGAINSTSITQVDDSTFTSDWATGGGGGLFNSGLLILDGDSLTDETAGAGGGGVVNISVLHVNNSTFDGDSTSANGGIGGGAIYNYAQLSISDSSFTGDYTTGAVGGGAIDTIGNPVSITGSTFAQDYTSGTGGGGAILNGSGGGLTLINSTFASNSASMASGGAIEDNGSTTIVNCTIVGNTSANSGGAVQASADDGTTIYNSIVSGNINGNTYTVASDIAGTINPASGSNITGVTNSNLWLAPLGNYTDLSNPSAPETMAPLPGSPAIDAGSSALFTAGTGLPISGATDARGQNRLYGSSVDDGAVEIQGYTLSVVSGSGQTANTFDAFTNPLVVKVTPANDPLDPVNGGFVTFTVVPGNDGQSATLCPQRSIISNTLGSVTATANSTAGTFTVVATSVGATNTVTFTLANTVPTQVAASPTISTTPGGTVVIGSGSILTDTATLAGGNSETGTIVFTLYSPTNVVVDTETVTVSGNGSYSTPNGYVPTSTGTYEWVASYGGDTNNNPVSSAEGNEPEVVIAASPAIATTPGATVVIGSGAKLTDSATLSGGYNETGTIVFTLYSPTNAIVDTETVTVSGNGIYSTPAGYVPTSTGTYEWVASYGGDSNNNGASSSEGSEPEVVTAASPAIATTPGPTVVIGSGAKLTDSAMLSGGYNETGTIVFTLYSPTNAIVDTETVTVSGNGIYSTPNGYVPTSTGTYEWVASYGGDSNNNGASSSEGSEPEVVTAASPAIATTPGGTVVIGSGAKLTDSATLSGGYNETGTIVFTLYSPTNAIVDTETVTVSGNGIYSTPNGYVPTSTGTYEWVASYGGDSNNNGASSSEGSEPELVTAASPAIATTPGATVVIGSGAKLTDSATLSGGYNETGTIVFTLYSPTNAVVDSETVTVSGNGIYSTPNGYVPTSTGTYEWVASYGGDSNNNGASSSEGSEPELVTAASPAISTTPGATVVIGSGAKLTDSATLSGGYNETGTIVFTLYSPTNAIVDTETVTVIGNGIYSTPAGYVPTSTGTYEWVASYGGDSNNNGASSSEGSEPELVTAASPAIATTPGGTVVIGSGAKLTDTATLSGGYYETGTIVFTLYSPTNAVVDTETVTVSGNGIYSTPNGYVPTSTGTYEWVASYGGDSNNNAVSGSEGDEPEVVIAASPTITTTPGGSSQTGLTDTATLSGGYNETGTIVFTLYSPTNTVVDTETVTVSGNGNYSTPTGYVPMGAGTYEWDATYSGDANDNSATDNGDSNEQTTVNPANPTITTTPGPTVVVGSGAKLSDSATLSGGYDETGTIVFTLYSPTNVVVDTETVSVSGNGSYSTPAGYVPTSAGTYEWVASYGGDSNNDAVSSPEGSEPEVVSAASPAISTTPGGTVVIGSGAKLTDSATLSGGYNETGTIVFTLYSPTNVVVDTETVTVSGNGIYSTPAGYVPTSTGTYEWVASYGGDNNNNSVGSPKGSEPEVVNAASPAISTTPGGTVVIGSGAKLTDSATLSGGYNETGTIVFTLYSPTNVVVDTETVTVSGNGIYSTPSGYVPTSTGTYEWVASYGGDNNNNSVGSPKGSEPEVVNAASPAISTTPGGTVVIGSGAKLTDSATLSGGYNETGTIVFTLYSPTNVVVDTETVTVSGNGIYSTPNGYVPTSTGTYEWVASYGGDSNNNSVGSPKGSEPEVVNAASPAISTTPGGTVVIGSGAKLTDSATLSGGYNETGSITFSLYSPTNVVVDTVTVAVSGNGTYSVPTGYTPTSAGTYEWAAAYSGDSNNNAVSSPKTAELEVVSAASPAISTTPGGTVVLGSAGVLTDSATLSGGYNETGSITFSLYSPTNVVVDTVTVAVSGNGTYSVPTGYTPTSAGTYEWAAAYSGDSNNNAVSSPKTAELEVVNAASPTISTTPGATVVIGSSGKLTDSATLSGGYNETGSITFSLYNPTNVVVDTVTVAVSGNGTYSVPTGYTPTSTGTYEWAAAYSGDSNNNAVSSPKTAELEVVSAASPTITTTPGGTVAIGSGSKLTDTATLAGGYNETGTVTFTLYSPTNTVVDTETATVSGNGSVSTPSGYTPTSAGTYQWVASYSGDANNNSVISPKGSEPEVAIPAQQIDLTVVKTESTSQICPGNNVTYTVTVSNATGYGTATGVLLTDVLPSGLSFVSATPSVGTYSSTTGVWTLGTLASGSTATLQVVAKTSCYGVFINTATVTAANQVDVDTNPTSSVTLVVGAALTGTVYVDNNGDCQDDAGDSGLANVTVELVDSYGKVVLTTTSSSTGGYSFLGVAPGNYQVEFIAPSGYLFDCIDGTAVNNNNCDYNNYNNCGNYNSNNCGNYNFNWCGQSFGGCDGGSSNCGYTCTSCGGGSFSYTYCDTGNSNCNWSWNNCGNNGYNSCNTGGNVGSACVTLVCGTTTTGFNAGAYQPGTIGDFVWLDSNGNGLIDSNEPGLRNITVELLNSTGKSVLETTQTNSQGYYSFTNLTPGQYVVEFISPCGYVFTTEGVGSNAAINSSANPKTGQTSAISLASGETDNDVNAGLYQPASVCGTVYVDYNNDGHDDCGDPGLTGITVELLNSSGQIVQSTTTGCSGTYSFSNLAPGTYTIYVPQTQSALTGFLAGKDTIGTVNGSTDGTLTSTGIISNVVLTSGASGVNYNFGESAQGQTLTDGDCGSIAFWNSQTGENLLTCLNGGTNATGLGNWLSTTFANIYGKNCGAFNMTAKTNSQVWQIFQTLVNQCGTSGQCAAQVLVCAFNCYVTNSTLCSTVACNYGFTVCAGGSGNCMFNVWDYGQAAGAANNTVMSVMQIVLYCNTRAVNGSLYNGNTNLQSQADDLFTAINQAGDIGAD
jgi:hypothetical protein